MLAILLASHAAQLIAQPAGNAAAALEREQQSAEFALRLRQSQQAVELDRLRPGDLRLRQEMESLHLQQRQRLDSTGAAQRLEMQIRQQGVGPAGVPASPLEFERERSRGLDQAERELADQLRRAAREKSPGDAPRWGPTP